MESSISSIELETPHRHSPPHPVYDGSANRHIILPNVPKLTNITDFASAKTESDILTILEVASYLKVAERTVYRLAAAKKIPAFKVGGPGASLVLKSISDKKQSSWFRVLMASARRAQDAEHEADPEHGADRVIDLVRLHLSTATRSIA